MRSSWIKSSAQRSNLINVLWDFVLSTILSQKIQKSFDDDLKRSMSIFWVATIILILSRWSRRSCHICNVSKLMIKHVTNLSSCSTYKFCCLTAWISLLSIKNSSEVIDKEQWCWWSWKKKIEMTVENIEYIVNAHSAIFVWCTTKQTNDIVIRKCELFFYFFYRDIKNKLEVD